MTRSLVVVIDFINIDIYYEFERAEVRHRVIIECKDWNHPVKREQINSLESKVRDIPGVIGVIVSKAGYQSGAINFAQKKGILALTIDELPSLGNVIANRLKTVLLPDENCIGEPFWGIMETVDGQITTPTWFALRFDSNDEMLSTPLFFSKYHAELFFKQRRMSKKKWAIRGLPRYVLRAFIIQLEGFEIRQKLFDEIGKGAVLMFLPPDAKQSNYFSPIPITRE